MHGSPAFARDNVIVKTHVSGGLHIDSLIIYAESKRFKRGSNLLIRAPFENLIRLLRIQQELRGRLLQLRCR